MTLALVLLGCAVLLVPVTDRPAYRGRVPASTDRSGTRLVTVAVLATGAAAVALLGVTSGLVAAAVLCPAGWFGLRRVTRAASSGAVDDPALPLVLDLTAAALRSGRPLDAALAAAAPAAQHPLRVTVERIAGLLRLGAAPAEAWAIGDGVLVPVAAVAVRSASSGVRLAASFERLAGELRDESAAAAASRAQRAGVLAMGPLGACFLPSFVLLGIVPVVVGMAGAALSGAG